MDMVMRRVKGWQEWGKQRRAPVPTVASLVVMWGMVAGRWRLDVVQEHLPGSNCKYTREL